MAIYIMKPWYKKASGDIYGVEWDGSSTTLWTRTDDAVNLPNPNPYYLNMSGNPSSPFDNIMPWAGMVRVSDANAGELVAIPKFYFKLDYANETNPRGLKIQISMVQHTGFQCSPAHMDRGDGQGERDVVYVGRYHCSSDSLSLYKSETGVSPAQNQIRAGFRLGIHDLGATIWQWDYATLLTIQMLYLVEFANWNSQDCIGYGCGNGSSVVNTGSTDAMPYHTGTNETSRTTYGNIQYRNIEDLWSNCYSWIDGIRFSGDDVYSITNPSEFSDSLNGTLVGIRPTDTNYVSKYAISSTNGFTWFWFPSGVTGTEYTYTCDAYFYGQDGVTAYVGAGAKQQYQSRGMFFLTTDRQSGYYPNECSSRLMKL